MSGIGVVEVSDFFLNKESMSPKKLQKLTYYAEAWHQALLNEKLINDDNFEAWVHGPVAPTLYQKYKEYGWQKIPKKVTELNFDDNTLEILESVWNTYGNQDGNSLEALTHTEMPWKKARLGFQSNENSQVVISPDGMREYYKSIYIGD